MAAKVTYSDGLNWRSVNNTVKKKIIDGVLLHTLKATKKIKRRTKALNIKLNRRIARKNYHWYVKTKTSILRKIIDNDDTDDDVKAYTIAIEPSRNNSSLTLQCSSQSEDGSVGFSDSDSDNEADYNNLPGKQKSRKRINNTIASHSSPSSAKRKKENNEIVPEFASVAHDLMQEKSSMNVKKRLTSFSNNFKDNCGIIDKSVEIDNRDHHEFCRNTKLSDSVQSENFSEKITSKNTKFRSDKISMNSDAESNDKPITKSTRAKNKSEEEEEEEEEDEEDEEEEKCKDVSIGSFNSVSTDDEDNAKLLEKQSNEKRDNKASESDSSEQLAKTNLQENKNESRAASIDYDKTQDKNLIKVKRNLTSLWKDFKDDSGIIDEGIDIDNKGSHKLQQTTDLQDSVQSENFSNKTICENTEFESDKISVDSEAESIDKPLKKSIRSRPESRNEEEKREEKENEKEGQEEKKENEKEEQGEEEEDNEEEEQEEEEEEKENENVKKAQEEEKEIENEKKEQEKENEKEEESIAADTVEEEAAIKRSQPVITSTEIVKAKYTIVRDEDEILDPDDTSNVECPIHFSNDDTFPNDQESSQLKKLSAESRQIAQSKTFNLISFNSSDSQEIQNSQDNRVDIVSPDSNRIDDSDESQQPSCSQIISDPSNSEESMDQPDDTNHDTIINESTTNQIRKQKNSNSSTPLKKIAETPTKIKNNTSNLKKSGSGRLTKNDALQKGKSLEKLIANANENEQCCANELRPIELCEFVDREGLVVTEELSTITTKDFKELMKENSDENIWLMEIPKSIIADGDELCGKTIKFKNGKIKINGTTYKSKCRNEKSLTCILRSRKKKPRFKTVNMEAISCIVVRQELPEKTTPQLPVQSACKFRSFVPFPKNLKSRNPLLGLNPLNGMDHLEDGVKAKTTSEILQSKKNRMKKSKHLECE